MCVGDGAILTKNYNVLKHPDSNSHEDILELHNLGGTDVHVGPDREWLRIELHPQVSLLSTNPDDWKFVLDADGKLPAWYNLEMAEKYVKEKLMAELKEGRYKNWLGRLDLPGCTGLTALPELPNMKHLDLRGCTGLTALPELPNVESLDLEGCTGLTALPELPNMKHLDLEGCTGLTALPELPNMEYLYLEGCTGLTALPELPNMKHLDLRGCTGLTALPELPNVESLDLRGCTGLTALPELPNMESLDLPEQLKD